MTYQNEKEGCIDGEIVTLLNKFISQYIDHKIHETVWLLIAIPMPDLF